MAAVWGLPDLAGVPWRAGSLVTVTSLFTDMAGSTPFLKLHAFPKAVSFSLMILHSFTRTTFFFSSLLPL